MDTRIDKTWSGAPIDPSSHALVKIDLGDALRVSIDAPFHGDPSPESPPGQLWGLWEHEVVEIFLLGTDRRYLEIELGPFGHHLVLSLHGVRQITGRHAPLSVHTERLGGRWRGEIGLDVGLVPPGLCAFNAYAIHGLGQGRRHLAAWPVPGETPDFHRLDHFAPWPSTGTRGR